jgi:hypothetical protein
MKDKLVTVLIIIWLVFIGFLFFYKQFLEAKRAYPAPILIFKSLFSKNQTFQAEKLPGMTGQIVDDEKAIDGQAKSASKNQVGYLIFGPYIPLVNGRYQANFRLKTDRNDPGQTLAALEVVKGDYEIIASQTINSQDFSQVDDWQNFKINFETSGGKAFQFRIFALGEGDIWVDEVRLEVIDRYFKELFSSFPARLGKVF